MALGFGFNKAKILSAAEKFVQQGKLQAAVVEYQKILKDEPNDLTVLNTVGDLFSRLGNNAEAINFFRKVGDAYAAQGFTVKAIAMYKKLVKLGAPSTEMLLKLADLYTQQGLYNDARAQYTALAQQCLKSGDTAQAAKIFQKILELDPENVAMQAKLAELYTKIGKKDEAKGIYLNAAQGLYARGMLDQAEEALKKVLAVDAGNIEALTLAGQLAVDGGRGAKAIEYLSKVPDIESKPAVFLAFVRAQAQAGQSGEVEELLEKLVVAHKDLAGARTCAESLFNGGRGDIALRFYERHAAEFMAANSTEFLNSLHAGLGKIRDSSAALESMRSLYQKAGDASYLNEVNELLAHAYVQEDQLEKARDLYRELSTAEPDNPLHGQNYKQIMAKLGQDSAQRPLSREEASQAFLVDELEHSSAVIHQPYAIETQEAILQALTDAELFASYNQAEKALVPLEAALPRAPHDIQLNQQLASLYAKVGRHADAARACSALAQVYGDKGFVKEQRQYGEMAQKYASTAGLTSVPVVPYADSEREQSSSSVPEAPVLFAASSVSAFQFENPSQPTVTSKPLPPSEGGGTVAEFTFRNIEAPPQQEGKEPPARSVASTPAVSTPPAAREDVFGEWEDMLTIDAPTSAAKSSPPAVPPAVVPPANDKDGKKESPPSKRREPESIPAASAVGGGSADLAETASKKKDETEDAATTGEREPARAPKRDSAGVPAVDPAKVPPKPPPPPRVGIPPPAASTREVFPVESVKIPGLSVPRPQMVKGSTASPPNLREAPSQVSIAGVSDVLEEIRFYLSQSMPLEAAAAIERLAALSPAAPELSLLRFELAAVQASAVAAQSIGFSEAAAISSTPAGNPAPPEEVGNVSEFHFDTSILKALTEKVEPETPVHEIALDSNLSANSDPTPRVEAAVTASPVANPPSVLVGDTSDVLDELTDIELKPSPVDAGSGKTISPAVTTPRAEPPPDDLVAGDIAGSNNHEAAATPGRLIETEPPSVRAELAAIFAEPPRQRIPAAGVVSPPPAEPVAVSSSANVLEDLVLDLEEALGSDFGSPAPEAAPVEADPPPAMRAANGPPAGASHAARPEPAALVPEQTGSVLADLLDEFKDEFKESPQETEDPETHYNLGVAFKEMNLLDEAIGELQKVCHAIDGGYPFTQKIQAYTWLAHCLTEKGVPQAAVRWYERALHLPDLDEGSKQAIHYDLGAALEAAGDRKAALQNFMEVYGSNIDYRDVAERIKALRS